jgi:hypothetical protein
VPEDAEHGALRAVCSKAGLARDAGAAAAVDLADDAPARQRAILRNAHELVAQDAAEAHVAANQLKIGFADAGSEHADEDITLPLERVRVVVVKGHSVRAEHQRTHPDD